MRIFFEKRIIGRILTAGRLFWEIISSLVILESSWREDNFLVKVLKSWKIHFGEEYLFMLSFDIWQKWSFVIQDSWKIFLERSIFFFFFAIDIRQEESFFLEFWTVGGFSWNSAALSEWYWMLKEENNVLTYLKRTLRESSKKRKRLK